MKIFITGTDTNIGKTYVSVRLLHHLNKRYQTVGAKLIASGCEKINNQYYNQDALLLQKAASAPLPYELVNPFELPLATTPYIAATHAKHTITMSQIDAAINQLLKVPANIYLFEGAGGWHVPIAENILFSDIAIQHQFAVIMVVGMRLGCINHSLLTMRAMQNDHANIIGWIANCIDPHMLCLDEHIALLQKLLPVPCLQVVQFAEKEISIDLEIS